MYKIKYFIPARVLLAGFGCAPERQDIEEPLPPPVTMPPDPMPAPMPMPMEFQSVGRALAYSSCDVDSDCEDGLVCFDLLGSKVCTVIGCASGVACPNQAPCVVSDAIAPTGVCASVGGGDPFCARSCRDPLACNLDPECNAQGCCTELTEDGCPATCKDLPSMECMIAPQCDADCCVEG